MLINVRFQTERHHSSMPITVIRLIVTEGARSWGLHNQKHVFFTHTRRLVWHSESPGYSSACHRLCYYTDSQTAPLKNITFQYKKLHYKLLHCKFNTLKKCHPGKPHRNFKFALDKAVDSPLLQRHLHWECGVHVVAWRCGHPHKPTFWGWFTEAHKYIAVFLFTVPSQLIFLIIDWSVELKGSFARREIY